ncbi:hypothetical protein OKA06_20435 [Novosphingobium sp. MW5]|nr:hypothetical protein [Novosphingobium sp. MW5]
MPISASGRTCSIRSRPRPFTIARTSGWAPWPRPDPAGHKYTRGHAVVFSGPMARTGAARLAAGAALRAGAGLVTLASPPDAMMVNASHLTVVMLNKVADVDAIPGFLADKRLNAVLIGPGYGVGDETCAAIAAILECRRAVVLDADALTEFCGGSGCAIRAHPGGPVAGRFDAA